MFFPLKAMHSLRTSIFPHISVIVIVYVYAFTASNITVAVLLTGLGATNILIGKFTTTGCIFCLDENGLLKDTANIELGDNPQLLDAFTLTFPATLPQFTTIDAVFCPDIMLAPDGTDQV